MLRDLPDELADYKGFSRFRPELLSWLEPYDDDSWGPAAAAALAGDIGWILR